MKICLKFFSLSLLFLTLTNTSHASADDFCKDIDNIAKKKQQTLEYRDVLNTISNTLVASNSADCSKIKELISGDTLFVDARDKASRKSTGSFPGTAKITSDHHSAKKDIFSNETKLVKRANKALKKKGKSISSYADLNNINVLIYCNGLTCYRSPHAACVLNKKGVNKDKLYVVLDGYDGLKESCLK